MQKAVWHVFESAGLQAATISDKQSRCMALTVSLARTKAPPSGILGDLAKKRKKQRMIDNLARLVIDATKRAK